jgi:hypothetical protein
MIERATVVLPQPLSPTTPRISPSLTLSVRWSMDGLHHALIGVEIDDEIVDL